MAKIGLTKLGLSIDKSIKKITWNDQVIEIKQYLPINDKLKLCEEIIQSSVDDSENFYNYGKLTVYTATKIVEAYTNINFTEKQKEDVCKLFDLFKSTGLLNMIYKTIPEEEINIILEIVDITIENIYKYRNSALGILTAMKTDYNNLDFDASAIQAKLADGENIEFLKEVMTKLG